MTINESKMPKEDKELGSMEQEARVTANGQQNTSAVVERGREESTGANRLAGEFTTKKRKKTEESDGSNFEQRIEVNAVGEGEKAAGAAAAREKQNDLSGRESRSRKGSIVSFKERSELYEVDLEAARNRRHRGAKDDVHPTGKRAGRPPALLSLRYYVMAMALVSPFIVTYSRTIINFAIISMIHPDFVGRGGSSSSSRASNTDISPAVSLNSSTAATAAAAYFELDNSCPVSEQVRERLLGELSADKRRSAGTSGEKFEWDTDKQGLLKAAYSFGHMTLQVIGGRLSEIYGPQLIMSLSAGLVALACLAAPMLASAHFYLLFADLFLLGIVCGFMTPALITLFTNWLTPSEKSLMMNFYLVSSRLGYALSSLLCGLLINAQLSWRYLFYSAGWVALLFALAFYVCSRNTPLEHPLIREAELEYLASKNTLVREALERSTSGASGKEQAHGTELKPVGGDTTNAEANNNNNNNTGHDQKAAHANPRKTSAPWAAILTNLPVWAFITTKFCVKLAGDTVQTELPAYLQRVMHVESKYNGYINFANYVIFCVSCLSVGMLAKTASKRHPFGWSKTTIRKLFQCTASFGVSVVLLGVSLSVCHESWTLGLFMVMFFVTTFSTGGEAQLPLDLSERYAGTIHAIGSSLAVSGAIEPIIVGYFLRGHASDRYRWEQIWLVASGVAFLGGLVFLIFGEAKIQPFDSIEQQASKAATKEDDDQHKPASVEASKVGHYNTTFVPDNETQVSKQANGNSSTNTIADADKKEHRESVQI